MRPSRWRNSRAGASPASRSHDCRAQGILGTAAATLGRNAGAATGHRNGGRAGAGNAAACRSRSPVAHRRHRHRFGRDFTGAVVRIAGRLRRRHRHQRRLRLQTANINALHLGLAPRPIRGLRLRRGAVGRVRSDRVKPTLYPLRRDRRSRQPRCAITIRLARSTAARKDLTPIAPSFRRPRAAGAGRRPGGGSRAGPKQRNPGIDDAAGLTCSGLPKPIWQGSGGRSRAEKCPHKARLKSKKTTWNIPRERLRSGHNIGPGLLAP